VTVLERHVDLVAHAGPSAHHVVTEDGVARLPDPIRRYLHFCDAVGMPVPRTVRIRQEGHMRLRRGGRWMPFTATQRFTTEPAGFVWEAGMRPLPFWTVHARDELTEGNGRMTVRPLPGWTLIDATGPQLSQSAAQRVLSEMIWFPGALTLPYVSWTPIDEGSAMATLTLGHTRASVTFHVSPGGYLSHTTADRYRAVGRGRYELTRWSTPIADYQAHSGVLVPLQAEAVWHDGPTPFTYFSATISNIHYDFD
jgi:hypothetical protein